MKGYLFIIIIMMSCSSTDKEEKALLREAAVLHNEMIEQAERLKESIILMEADSSYTTIHDSLAVWKEAIVNWESDLVEVPGNEEHHHKEGEHHHDHQQLNVTALQMLTIQKELQSSLNAIQLRVDTIIKSE